MQEATGGRTERGDNFFSLAYKSPECPAPADSQDLFTWHAGDTPIGETRLPGGHCYLSDVFRRPPSKRVPCAACQS